MDESRRVFLLQLVELSVTACNRTYEAGNLWLSDVAPIHIADDYILLSLSTKMLLKQEDVKLPLESQKKFTEIDETCFMLLLPLTLNVRLKFYNDRRDLLHWASMLSIGAQIQVQVKNDDDQMETVSGVVRYIGALKPEFGQMFGIELTPEHEGKGTSNGTFKKYVYFQCQDDSAVFVNVSRLVEHRGHNAPTEGSAGLKTGTLPVNNCPLQLGDRIVWMSDSGPEHGTVKWIGVLPDVQDSSQLTVGVEFDNPVGSGTGRYKSHVLFQARRQHASLVPILGLLKESDFIGSQLQFEFAKTQLIDTDSAVTQTSDAPATLPDVVNVTKCSESSMKSSLNSMPKTEPSTETLERVHVPISGVQKGKVLPPSIADVDFICGVNRGIQCYSTKCSLEVVTFTMFSFYSYFDMNLFAGYEGNLSGAIRRVLVENVVNPMRASSFVSANNARKFADLFSLLQTADLAGCATANVVLTEDPADVIKYILHDLLCTDPLVQLENASDYVYTVDPVPSLYPFPRVQHLLERAVLDVPMRRLASVPRSIFIVKVDATRFGKLVPGGKIFPALTLDVSGLLLNSSIPCCMCGSVIGSRQCGDCFVTECNNRMTDVPELSSFTYCEKCYGISHQKNDRRDHQPFILRRTAPIEHDTHTMMELFAIISTIGDHFVSYFKAGQGESAAWLMYDPKAKHVSRSDGQGDTYIPEIKHCVEIEKCLSDINAARKADTLPDVIAKLISGLRLCFYRPSTPTGHRY